MTTFISKSEFDRISGLLAQGTSKKEKVLQILGDMYRVNVLAMIAHAKSGHIGASYSIMDCLVALYHDVMKCDPADPRRRGLDRLIISKGHAVPSQYAVLAGRGYFPVEKLADFRAMGGLQGHPDMFNTGIDANTGSLGMGLSKGKGIALASRIDKEKINVYVVLGDGELAEGQNWEAMQNAAHYKLDNLVAIIDRNQFQTDSPVNAIMEMGVIEDKLKTFGWHVTTIDGHDYGSLLDGFSALNSVSNMPKAIILNTVKGKGVSFMEPNESNWKDDEPYVWHGRCPDPKEFNMAADEIYGRIDSACDDLKTDRIQRINPAPETDMPDTSSDGPVLDRITVGFGKKLVELGGEFDQMVVLDADLERDCLLDEFHRLYPDRFFQMGIAEQDMVSTAGGMAIAGKIAVVNSYTAFLTSRSNEQIFNNSSEKNHIIYIGHFAGILPAKPGKSHLGIRDISCLRAIPNMMMIEPINASEAEMAFEFLVREHKGPGYLRLRNMPASRETGLPDDYRLEQGKGTLLRPGKDLALIVSCPILTPYVLDAAEELDGKGMSARVIHMPWLNNVSVSYLKEALDGCRGVLTVENHMTQGGAGDEIGPVIAEHMHEISHKKLGINEFGQSGDIEDILRYYKLDVNGITEQAVSFFNRL